MREASIAQDHVSSIYFGALDGNQAAPDFAIAGPGGANAPSRVREVGPGVIELTAIGSLGACTIGDVGHYQWSTSADGTWLTMTKVDDPCANRAAITPGTWVRNGSTDSHGGPLVSANFEPFFSFTLPNDTWLGGGGGGVMTADSTSATFKVWLDPDGFNDYCNDAMGRKVLERGIDPFLTFIRQDSGLTIANERETTVDGHRAVIFDMGGKADVPRPCWTNPDNGETNMILQWGEHADVNARWATDIGAAPWPIVVTEVNGHTLVIEDVKGANTLDQSVLDSIRFLDALPTPPAS